MTTDKYNFTFEGGLNEYYEASALPQGTASVMQNWVPEPNGVARVRRGWEDTSEGGAPATCKGRGLKTLDVEAAYETPVVRQWVKAPSYVWNPAVQPVISNTWPEPTLEGSLLVLVATWVAPSPTTVATAPVGWTLLGSGSTTDSTSGVDLQYFAYYIENAAERSGTEELEWDAASVDFSGMSLWEWTGVEQVSALDVQASNAAEGTTTLSTGSTVATSLANELWFGFIMQADGDSIGDTWPSFSGPNNGFVILAEEPNGSDSPLTAKTQFFYKTVSTTGVASAEITSDISDAHLGAIFTFKAKSLDDIDTVVVAVNANSTDEYELYYTNSVRSSEFNAIETVTLASGTNSKPLALAYGLGYLVYTHPAMSVARRWDTTATSDATNVPLARALAFHLSRLWAGGTDADPTKMSFSDLGAPTTWTATNYFYVGRDDGEPIEDLLPIENGLLIGKRSSLWFLSGNTTDNFQLDKLNAGGAAPGRSMCATPYGAVIAGREQVWLWSGGAPELVSRPIEDAYGMTGSFVTTAYADDKVYICDNASARVWVFSLDTGVWHREQRGGVASSGVGIIYADAGSLLLSQPLNSTALSLVQYRDVDSTRERDEGTQTNFRLMTPEVWLGTALAPVTPRRLILRLRQHAGDASDAELTITPYYDGEASTTRTITPRASAQVFRDAVSLGQKAGVYSVQFLIEQTNTTADRALMDIEEMWLEYQRQPERP